MNEHELPPDELASAFLDGELADSAADAVRCDPESAARADDLRRAADAVGAPVTPPPGAADAAVGAALADFDARRTASLEEARHRPRGLTVIVGVAAAVAVGFIVAAAVGLFAEQDQMSNAEAVAAPAPAPAAAAAELPPPAPEPPPPADAEPAADLERVEALATEALEAAEAAQAAADLARATAEGSQEAAAPAETPADAARAAADAAAEAAADALAAQELAEAVAAQVDAEEGDAAIAAAEAALEEAMAAAEAAMAEAAAAQAEAAAAQAEAAAAQAEAAAAAPAPAPPPADEPAEMMADDMMPDDSVLSAEFCAAAIGDGTIETQFTVEETQILVIRTPDGRTTALTAAACDEITPDDPPDDGPCAAAISDGTIETQFTVEETQILVIRTPDGRTTALTAAACDEITPPDSGAAQ